MQPVKPACGLALWIYGHFVTRFVCTRMKNKRFDVHMLLFIFSPSTRTTILTSTNTRSHNILNWIRSLSLWFDLSFHFSNDRQTFGSRFFFSLLSLKTRATSNRFSIVHVAGSFSNGWDTSRCSLYSECWTFALTRSSSSSSICEHAKWFKQKREIVMLLLLMMPPSLLLLLLLLCQCKQSSRDVEKMKWNQN